MTLLEYMEDFDNWDLSTEERKEQLMDAVERYNEEHGTNHHPETSYYKYEHERKKQDQ